ncbi:M20/M25/M40 family metallo-hydrolase [Salinactinospora qingdaonensis]|uniref:Acetylornithine deacetylase/Succinyl-diaminopimelate desuccinylase n=1 Tax=Salinactinospora qingdaonensis TaxID=702744 RepID=A0ABP7GHV3_9ACTN
MSPVPLLPSERDLLLRLLDTPTTGPLEEPETAPQLWQAQRSYAQAATHLGFAAVHHEAAAPERMHDERVPLAVRRAVATTPGFLDDQPNLVLRLGPPRPAAQTVMFNVHLDTVAGMATARFDGQRFHGRGAIDAKGPAVALLAGVRAAKARQPAIGDRVGVLIQAVSGEEGGAMGTFGTRVLVDHGFTGALNIFCEPTGLRYLPHCTAAMTARVTVAGRDSIDDRPERGHNASVLLGFLAQHLGLAMAPHAGEGTVCVAGLRTGPLHNRVYGTGELLVNLAYPVSEVGERMAATLESAFASGLVAFTERFEHTPHLVLTAREAGRITHLEWLKRGLPTLRSTQTWGHTLLGSTAGLAPWPDTEPAFTCDAIWMGEVADTFTAVLGPGDLADNNAHAAGEYADLAELEAFAGAVSDILVGFARQTATPNEATTNERTELRS